ncbi:dethiobiotin synthase [Cytobacillus firmus]|uniref:dethiobiotin synthase n=1 Tax=Cytobacillus firmus TaxID=1399 RepID=UPI0028EC1773|nr:dethiobiotin synthase [Cytobacillus firmus]
MVIRSLFITGTDTDAGKTTAAALLLAYLKKKGIQATAYKPVQSGAEMIDGVLSAPDVEFYKLANPELAASTTYLLKKPCSPHLAAREEEVQIEVNKIIEHYQRLSRENEFVLIEGAGGVFVPLRDDGYSMLDLMKELSAPVVIVARSGVGTINHTVLTAERLKQEGINVIGVIMNQMTIEDTKVEQDNIRMIELMTRVPVLGMIPYLENPLSAFCDSEMLEHLFSKLMEVDRNE